MTKPSYIFIGMMLGLGGIATILHLSLFGFGGPIQMSESNKQDKDKLWIRDGFTQYNNNFATKWNDVRVCDPIRMYTCVGIEVVGRIACQNLYVELTELTKDDINIGYTNATTAGLKAGEIARLDLRSLKSVGKYRLSKVSCY